VGIVHSDIKPENIMINYRKKELFLIDFGVSFYEGKKGNRKRFYGTVPYMAPELLLQQKEYIGKPIDIWGAGLVLYEWLTGKMLFENENDYETVLNQIHDLIDSGLEDFLANKNLGVNAINLITKILVTDPDLRITCEQALLHEYCCERDTSEEED